MLRFAPNAWASYEIVGLSLVTLAVATLLAVAVYIVVKAR